MAKISELLAGSEKLAKYDELTKWKNYFSGMTLPPHIKEIIVSAIDAEIKKLDEE